MKLLNLGLLAIGLTNLLACSTVTDLLAQPGAKAAVQYSVWNYIDQDTERAGRVLAVANSVLDTIEGNPRVTLEFLGDAVRQHVNWDALDATQVRVAKLLITGIEVELAFRIGREILEADDLMQIRTVVEWVIQVAEEQSG